MSTSTAGTQAEVLIIVYGSCSRDPADDERFSGYDQRRAEITLHPIIPPEAMSSMPAKNEWMSNYIKGIGLDVKHSRNWRCEFCRKHARETIWMSASWLHLSPPRMNCYVHSVCDAVQGECAVQLSAVNEEMGRLSGIPANPITRNVPLPPGRAFPMSASCAYCEKDETATHKQKYHLKTCTSCKVTRYCRCVCSPPL